MKENFNVKEEITLIKKEKGSIVIFVLVGLLFMSAFLLISYAYNVNKSKVAKEQFNIISDIYSYKDGEANAYERAYTALRKKNKKTLTSSVENSSSIELTKTYAGKVSNYKIYGAEEGVGDIKNLWNKDDDFSDVVEYVTSSYYGHRLELKPNTTYMISCSKNNRTAWCTYSVGTWYGQTGASFGWLSHMSNESSNVLPGSPIKMITKSDGYLWICTAINPGTPEQYKTVMNECFENLQIEEGKVATEYWPYGKCEIPLKITNQNDESITYNIVLDNSLKLGDYIDFKNKKIVRSDGTEGHIELPELSAYEDYTKIEVLTEVEPSKIEIEYTGYTLN